MRSSGATRSPVDEMKAVGAELERSVDAIVAPVDAADTLIAEIDALPAKVGLDRAIVAAQLRAALSSPAQASADSQLDAAAWAEMERVASQLKVLLVALQRVPGAVGKLGESAARAVVKLPQLAAEVTAEAQVTLANPLAGESDKARASSDMAEVAEVQTRLTAQVERARNSVATLPQRAAAAVAKLGLSLGLSVDALASMTAGDVAADAEQSASTSASRADSSPPPRERPLHDGLDAVGHGYRLWFAVSGVAATGALGLTIVALERDSAYARCVSNLPPCPDELQIHTERTVAVTSAIALGLGTIVSLIVGVVQFDDAEEENWAQGCGLGPGQLTCTGRF